MASPVRTVFEAEAPVYKVVLTGGPCGGKTTSGSVITERLQDLGWRVFRVPEAASTLLGGGVTFAQMDESQQFTFQTNLLNVMLTLEDAFVDIAKSCGQRSVVLCDRGAMDCSAYMDEAAWKKLLSNLGHNVVGLRDGRYECVIHLVTAANGAEDFYSLENNAVRSEGPEFAKEIDERIQQAWIGHPLFNVIDNSTDFRGKISRVVDHLLKHIGEDAPSLTKRKFLVEPWPEDDAFPVKFQEYDVNHDYLASSPDDRTQSRIRRRGQFGTYTYSLTMRYPDRHGQNVQRRRVLQKREYYMLKKQGDPTRETVVKKRRSFLWQQQYFEIDKYVQPHNGLYLLEAYLPKDATLNLPNFLTVKTEVTVNSAYSMYSLAAKQL